MEAARKTLRPRKIDDFEPEGAIFAGTDNFAIASILFPIGDAELPKDLQMKKYQFCHWLLVGTMTVLFGCQSRDNIPPPAPPEAPSQDQVPCRGEECDEEEAGEEARIEVIEFETPEEESAELESPASSEEKSAHVESPAANEQQSTTTNAAPSTEQDLQLQETSSVDNSSNPVPSASEEAKLDTPTSVEEPVASPFDSTSSAPISESRVTLP